MKNEKIKKYVRNREKEELTDLAARGEELLRKYKDAKASLEARIITDELFWRNRYNDYAASVKRSAKGTEGEKRSSDVIRPTSSWLFNTIINKHADLMDSMPNAICLPRERSDEKTAKTLSSVLPVILERNGFEKSYSDNAYYKIKHGVCAYGVFWDNDIDGGLGDITVRPVDMLNLFWEPGISDLQQSKNVFCVTLRDIEDVKSEYPDVGLSSGAGSIDITKYILDDSIDTSHKVLVIDWYYKKKVGTRTVLCLVKLCQGKVLYNSEADETLAGRGFYDHGKYPFVLDVLYPESGTPYGFGIISIAKDAQVYIDRLDRNILENSLMQSKVRYFCKKSAGINREQFLDFNEPIIEVESLNDDTVRALSVPSLDGIVVSVRDAKINEMKETSGNRDVNSGGTTGGVTSGAAIATLQEAGNKVSRDIINTSYRAFCEIVQIMIELIRQFYTESRTFRITEPNTGRIDYTSFSNADMLESSADVGGELLYRTPIYDIKVSAEKRSPFARLSQNETIMNLYGAGFFNPENAQAALIALEALEFEGKDAIIERVNEGQTLFNTCKQLQGQIAALSNQLGAMQSPAPLAPSDGSRDVPDLRAGSDVDRRALDAAGYANERVKEGISGL